MEEIQGFNVKEKLNLYFWYIMVGAISLAVLICMPLIGGDITKIGFFFPTTIQGWIFWGIEKALITTFNIILFTCFINQGKQNIKNHPNKLEADRILGKLCIIEPRKARSPKKWYGETYGKKLIFIAAFTIASFFVFEQAIIGYNFQKLLTYLFTIGSGIILGLIQMKKTEDYWTEEYLRYAQDKLKEKQGENNDNNRQCTIQEPNGTSTKE